MMINRFASIAALLLLSFVAAGWAQPQGQPPTGQEARELIEALGQQPGAGEPPGEPDDPAVHAPDLTPTLREVYQTAYDAASRASRGIDPEQALRAMQIRLQEIAAYLSDQFEQLPPSSDEPPRSDAPPQTLATSTVSESQPQIPTDTVATAGLPPDPLLPADMADCGELGQQLEMLAKRVAMLERTVRKITSGLGAAPSTALPGNGDVSDFGSRFQPN